jgi:hypothetical protein
MATLLQTQPYDTATANFKLWTGFIRTLFLTTCGWTATADTGQTNPTTVVTAPTTGNYIYEIYQATDALAGSAPLIAKIEYGQSGSCPSIAITIGTGSSGTGTITGGGARMRTNACAFNVGSTLGATTYDCVGSGDASGFRFLMWRNYAGTNPLSVPCVFAVERSRSSAGAYTGDYATVFMYGPGPDAGGPNFQITTGFRQQTVLASGAAGNLEPSWLTFCSDLSTAGLGANVAAIPCFPMPGYLGNPSEDLLCGKGTDFGEASSNSISIYGGSHTYFFTKVSNLFYLGALTHEIINGTLATPGSIAAAQGLLFRYE